MATRKAIKKRILWIAVGVFLIISTGILYLYINLNQVLTNALNNGFENNIISDVYELKFENLDVNILTGSVKVFNVKMNPRETPLQSYPYINSTFVLAAKKMNLGHVNLIKLIRSNQLELKKIELVEPGIEYQIADSFMVFFPFNETQSDTVKKGNKKSFDSYSLEEFSMKDAFFHVMNTAKAREFDIQKINLSLKDVFVNRQPGKDNISYSHFDFSIGAMTGKLNGKNARYVSFKDFKISIDSVRIEETPDTIIYHYADFNTGIKNLDVQTADSIYHVTMESLKLNYKEKSIELNHLSFKPNISDAAMQKRFTYRKEHFAGEIGSVELQGVNFDSLIYARKIWIDNVLLDNASISIYKDNTKPIPPDKRPQYLGQQLQAIPMPIVIGHIKVTHADLLNSEITPDGAKGKANISRGTIVIDNFTSLPSTQKLTINADAYIENSAHTQLTLQFDYNKPQFTINGKLDKFDLTDLNGLTNSYTPARIRKGMVDGITFSGTIYETKSAGTMKFLYHDLSIQIEMQEKAKWKSAVLGFAANTVLASSNPVSEDLPAKEVQFEVIRDPQKGFMNMMIKSVLDGLKETFLMSKENKQEYKKAKAEAKAKVKAESKAKAKAEERKKG